MIDIQENSPIELIQQLPYWENDEKVISAAPAGESNMNLVLRVKTTRRNLILKQSKSFVRKFPQIPAPIDRIEVEHDFYRLVETNQELTEFSPKVIHYDPENHILLTQDLGAGKDFMSLYATGKILSSSQISQLAKYLGLLHKIKPDSFPSNQEMKKLNHEHIFNFPFQESNGFDLDTIQPGLQQLSLPFKRNADLKKALNELGTQYLSTGSILIHGDFYPGSWLEINDEIKIIDPEFGFLGDPEFDLGVLFAHLKLSGQPEGLKKEFLSGYSGDVNLRLVDQYKSVEIMRRLIGIAQLPLNLTLEEKKSLLEEAEKSLIQG